VTFACIEGCSGVVRATVDDSHAADQSPACPVCGLPMELLKRGPGRPPKSAADKRRLAVVAYHEWVHDNCPNPEPT